MSLCSCGFQNTFNLYNLCFSVVKCCCQHPVPFVCVCVRVQVCRMPSIRTTRQARSPRRITRTVQTTECWLTSSWCRQDAERSRSTSTWWATEQSYLCCLLVLFSPKKYNTSSSTSLSRGRGIAIMKAALPTELQRETISCMVWYVPLWCSTLLCTEGNIKTLTPPWAAFTCDLKS